MWVYIHTGERMLENEKKGEEGDTHRGKERGKEGKREGGTRKGLERKWHTLLGAQSSPKAKTTATAESQAEQSYQ